MTSRLPFTPFIESPGVLPESAERPVPIATLTVRELCEMARIPCRATSPHTLRVRLHRGAGHFRTRDAHYVGMDCRRFTRQPLDALRVLEVLAHGFHDYVARESVCGRGLFGVPRRRGRPTIRGQSMTAAERMRRMRSHLANRTAKAAAVR